MPTTMLLSFPPNPQSVQPLPIPNCATADIVVSVRRFDSFFLGLVILSLGVVGVHRNDAHVCA
ncbi:MAG: hypothetical protein ACI3YC_05455, partial [Alloprevotella sp.]